MSYRVYDRKRFEEVTKKLLERHKELIEKANKMFEKARLSPPKNAAVDDPTLSDDPEDS